MNNKKRDIALIILRLAVGIIFITSGYRKLFADMGIETTTSMFQGWGIPFAEFFVYVVGLVEFFGGIAVLIGFWTEIAAFLLAVVMLVAFIMAKNASLPAGNVDMALFAINVTLMLMGPGTYVLVKRFKRNIQNHASSQSTPSDTPQTQV